MDKLNLKLLNFSIFCIWYFGLFLSIKSKTSSSVYFLFLASNEQTIDKFQKAFEKYFLKSLTSRLTDYSESNFEILEFDKKSSNYTIVNSKIKPKDGGPEIKIDWRIYTKNPDKPLIRDLSVEGLSLARTQKEEYASILNSNNNDINILINKLEEFVNN